jgi:hypothetical protein
MPRQRIHDAAVVNLEASGPVTERSVDSGISERQPGVTPGISQSSPRRGQRARRCVVPKLLKLTVAQSEQLNALSAAWGLAASDVLKRLLMKAYLEMEARKCGL